tara:strand:+ start:3626 stop:3892 length:267 start_codon:yes stop_codon:yes gene_type:complete
MGFGIDMAKAKNIHRQNIRFSRGEKFVELDIEFQRAVETGDTSKQAEVAAKKQVLRDAPANSEIDAATTSDELKAQWKTDILGETPYG